MKLHPLPDFTRGIESPQRFTYPFCYKPHPLAVAAADCVRQYLTAQPQWQIELSKGKMLGVLVVEHQGERYFLAAFSGTLHGQTQHEYFVPPVFDLMAPGCFFQEEELCITEINHEIEQLTAEIVVHPLQAEMQTALAQMKEQMQQHKKKRDELRRTLSPTDLCEIEEKLIRESQYQKAEYKRLQQQWKKRIEEAESANDLLRNRIKSLQEVRQKRSQDLQQWLFNQVVFLNANREEKTLMDVFYPFAPPSGAGDCCAPKLLQYAYQQGFVPLCMAEFWVGASPKDEIRTEGHYYPSCRSKCKPILGYMLQGLPVDENPLLQHHDSLVNRLKTIFRNEEIVVVSKPSGMLSVPGKDDLPSVYSAMKSQIPEAEGPLIVHRLDMDTSGLMVLSLTEAVYHRMQALFVHRRVKKTYIALLQRPMEVGQCGEIDLPLMPEYDDRPRQKVDHKHGKQALTRYKVLDNKGGHALVALYPETGRTHQLRVHCAHSEGLHNPIVGDRLYGTEEGRLMLHAFRLVFENKEFTDPQVFDSININDYDL